MNTILSRVLSEYPRVSQSDILQLLDFLTKLPLKDHAKLFKAETKALSTQQNQARLDVDRCRLDRPDVIPCKTTIETFKLTNTHRSPVNWKLLQPSQVTSQFFLSCTPTSGTLEKGKSVEIRISCVPFTFKKILDLLIITCSITDNPNQAYLPIMLHVSPNHESIREPYWSVDFSELTLKGASSSSTSNSATNTIAITTTTTNRASLTDSISSAASTSTSNTNNVSPSGSSFQSGWSYSPTSHSHPLLGSSPVTNGSGMGSGATRTGSSPLGRSDSPLTYTPLSLSGASFPSPSSSPFLVPSKSSSNVQVTSGTAELYGTKVHVRRWLIDSHELPPQACLDEIEVLKSLSHPNLVCFIGGRAELGQAYVITKLMEGGPFETFLKYPKGDGTMLLKRMEMILDIAYGMAFLHGKGIVHRHLSTSIMMMDEKRRLRLSEYGQSVAYNASASTTTTIAAVPMVNNVNIMNMTMNCCYLAPELLADPFNASMASDVFSFGVCLWETACATKPVRSCSDLTSGLLPSLSCDTTMFPDLVELINSCCNKDPIMRPSFSTIINELEAIRDTASTRTSFRFVLTRNKTIKNRLISSFPPSLVFLDMASNVHLTDDCITELPRKLVHLDLQMCPNLTDDSIQFLPATLTYLDLSAATKLTNISIPAMPRALIFLSLRDNTNLTEECLEYLPTGLLNLNLINSSKLTESCLTKLPKTLLEFTMPCAWIPAFKDEFIKFLPPLLTALNFPTNTSLTSAGLANLPQTIKVINLAANSAIGNSALSILPRNLESLNVSAAAKFTDDGLQFLPKSLQHLNLSRNKNIGHLGIRVLPHHLLSLNISASQNIWDMSIRSMPRSLTILNLSGNKQITDEGIKDLPPSLTELNLATNPNLTDNCVKFFPASLKALNLYWNVHFSDTSIRLLPRSLTELNLSSNENFTDSCIADLPRSLRVLYLRKCTNFTDACIKYLPRSLTHLDLTSSKSFTDECISDMPPGLVTLELWKNKNLSKDSLRARLPSMKVLALNVD
jgi:hypothetical protein